MKETAVVIYIIQDMKTPTKGLSSLTEVMVEILRSALLNRLTLGDVEATSSLRLRWRPIMLAVNQTRGRGSVRTEQSSTRADHLHQSSNEGEQHEQGKASYNTAIRQCRYGWVGSWCKTGVASVSKHEEQRTRIVTMEQMNVRPRFILIDDGLLLPGTAASTTEG